MTTITDFVRLVRAVEENPEIVYLRYSRGPDADSDGSPSRDYESGVQLPGLAVTVLTPEPWWDLPAADWIARRVCKYAELGGEDRQPWILVGEVVGRGCLPALERQTEIEHAGVDQDESEPGDQV